MGGWGFSLGEAEKQRNCTLARNERLAEYAPPNQPIVAAVSPRRNVGTLKQIFSRYNISRYNVHDPMRYARPHQKKCLGHCLCALSQKLLATAVQHSLGGEAMVIKMHEGTAICCTNHQLRWG